MAPAVERWHRLWLVIAGRRLKEYFTPPYTCVYVNAGMCMSWHMGGGQRTPWGVGLHLSSCLRQGLLFIAACSGASKDSPVSASHLAMEMLGLQLCALCPTLSGAWRSEFRSSRLHSKLFSHLVFSTAPWLTDSFWKPFMEDKPEICPKAVGKCWLREISYFLESSDVGIGRRISLTRNANHIRVCFRNQEKYIRILRFLIVDFSIKLVWLGFLNPVSLFPTCIQGQEGQCYNEHRDSTQEFFWFFSMPTNESWWTYHLKSK